MNQDTLTNDLHVYFEELWKAEHPAKHRRMLLLGLITLSITRNDQVLLSKWIPHAVKELGLPGLEELMLQSLLFVGFPKTIEAFNTLRKRYPATEEIQEAGDVKASGQTLSKSIYGRHHPKLIDLMNTLHPDLARWMIEDGYGKVLSREGLTPQDREIAVLAALMASGMENQFRAHFRGALFAGVSQVDIVWYTNTFQCIIAAERREGFNRMIRRVLEDENNFLASRDARSGSTRKVDPRGKEG